MNVVKIAQTLIVAVALIAVPLSSSFADEAGVKSTLTKKGGYGAAGCGLGSMVVKQNNWMQIFALTLNHLLLSNQFWAILTGTSGCESGLIASSATKAYVQANREVLSKDIARGNGETLIGLATLAGCANSDSIGSSLQQQYGQIFTSADATDLEIANNVVSVLQQDSNLSCAL